MTLRTYQAQVASRSRKRFGRYWDAMHLQAEVGKLHLAVFEVLRGMGGEARRLTASEQLKATQAVLRCLNETLWLAYEWKVEVPSLEWSFPFWRRAAPPSTNGSLGRRTGLILAELVLDSATLLRVESRARVERSRVELSPLKLQAILLNLGALAGLLELVLEDEIGKPQPKHRKAPVGRLGLVKRRDRPGRARTDETSGVLGVGRAEVGGSWLSQPEHPTLDEPLFRSLEAM
ncbi:MAG: hypothetical protein C4332_03620 [Meiothermus sp.]